MSHLPFHLGVGVCSGISGPNGQLHCLNVLWIEGLCNDEELGLLNCERLEWDERNMMGFMIVNSQIVDIREVCVEFQRVVSIVNST
jgi:hypothetical protein